MFVGLLALAALVLSLWRLEGDRSGLEIVRLDVGSTPATLYRLAGGGPAPTVVIAHGFAGSRPLMEPFALTLAQAGYQAVIFDFEGHGRNPVPMSGDVTRIDGTTQLLMDETGRVADAALAHPGADGRLAYLGHSMASDIVVRQAIADERAGATVAVSMFSQAVDATDPRNLLVVTGAWEGMLAAEALRVLRLTDPGADAFRTVGDMAEGTARRVVLSPGVEHVGVLYSVTSLAETRAWLDAVFDRPATEAPVPMRGGWVALALVAVVVLAWPLAGLLPAAIGPPPPRLPARRFAVAVVVPALAAPLLLWPVETRILPVLVADYLVLHFALSGALTLALLARFGALRGQFPAPALPVALAVAAFGILLFGAVLDRYVASFFPHPGRVAIVAGLALGAVPWMLGDALLTEGGRAGVWRTVAVRVAMLASLGLAVALNFERLFFLLIILPVVLLYFLLFGMIGGWAGRRTGLPAASGAGLGLILAWALGVTFPLFQG